MINPLPPVPPAGVIPLGTDILTAPPGGRSLATRDHEVIKQWAARHSAHPAIDESTEDMPDSAGPKVRFNFPGTNRYRTVSWDDWFRGFDQQRLVFVFEESVADRAHELWENRGAKDGQALDDWVAAQRQLHAEGVQPTGGYRFVQEK